jgi:hypothetical protein
LEEKNYQAIMKHDDLFINGPSHPLLKHYREGLLLFEPTYKYDIGSNNYNKQRVPAWCDRVLFCANNLKLVYYNRGELNLSDHKPIIASFICNINEINKEVKKKLEEGLFEEFIQMNKMEF